MIRYFNRALILVLVVLLTPNLFAQGSLKEQFNDVFTQVINIDLGAGQHGNHFRNDLVDRNRTVIEVIENYLAVNTAAYPLTSSAASVVFDFSGGAPVAKLSDPGPIYSQRAETLGKGRLSLGFNYTVQKLKRIRGVNTSDLSVSFFHQNLGDTAVFGDLLMEQDYIDMQLDLDISASVFALFATYGLSDRIDVGVAVPVVSVNIQASTFATMHSMSQIIDGSPLHYWEDDLANPTLTFRGTPMDEGATGIGDIALRLKYKLTDRPNYGLAAYVEYRLPTGNEDDFLGTGNSSFRTMLIGSSRYGLFTPHANLGMDFRGGDYDRNEVELTIGYDFQASDKVTLMTDWIGEFEMGDSIDELQFPGPTIIKPTTDNSIPYTRAIQSSNIPNAKNDNITNISVGAKVTLSSKLIAMGNLLIPTGTSGLRANVVPTFGLELAL